MGAPRKWFKQLLGLKKSEKIVSLEDAEKSSGTASKNWEKSKHTVETEKYIFGTVLNENVDTELEDAEWEYDLDPLSIPSTSLQAENAAQFAEDEREESPVEYAKDADEPQKDQREESPVEYAKEEDSESDVDSPTSLEVVTAAQLQQYAEEATADVEESFEPDPDPSSSSSSSEELAAIDVKDAELVSPPDASSSPSGLLEVQSAVQVGQNMNEEFAARYIQTALRGFLRRNGAKTGLPMSKESAAICIQTVYRGFLAKRALRGLKGMARLQALMKGHTLERQTAIALRCIQALVKVQARSRAKHVRTALESQAVQQKLLQQLEHEEAPVEKPEAFTHKGWCDKVGSAREIQAKSLRRKEAAAKLEKAKAYALARQWQAGIRQQPQKQQKEQQQQQETHGGFPLDKTEWGWSWLEKWVAVRPWETHLLGDATAPRSPLLSAERKVVSSIVNAKPKLSPRLSNTKKVSNDRCSPSPKKAGNAKTTSTTPPSSKTQKTAVKGSVREATKRVAVGSRSFSTPKERLTVSDNQEKKRLSLPGTVHGARLLAQTTQKPGNSRTKLSANDGKTSKLSR